MRRAFAVVVAACLLGLTAGCGGGGEQSETGGSGTTTGAGPKPDTGVALKRIGNFDQPLYITQPPDGNDLYVVEKAGRVRVIHKGKTLHDPFLDISNQVSSESEQGLLSIAFAPDYQRSGLLYAYYTDLDGDQRVAELRHADGEGNRVDASSERLVLKMEDFASNHNGGLLLFGPDGHLYVGTGDGGIGGDPERNGQDLSSLLGKILRIDPRKRGSRPYTVPASNPFTGEAEARPEVYEYGLRNPWRFSFDANGGDLAIGDVGQDAFEEIDVVTPEQAPGANFGWSAYEADKRYNADQSAPDMIKPVLAYPHGPGCSVAGGYFVHDAALPSLEGRYLWGDFCTGALRSFRFEGGEATGDRALGLEVPSLSSFGTDDAGHIYVASIEGPVYRLVAAG